MSLKPILNRDGAKWTLAADGWVQLAPQGEFPHPSGVLQVLDAAAFDSIAQRTPLPVLVDYDHFSYDPDKPTEAAGWITALQPRADGLYGRIDWTDAGQAAVANGRYRLLSPVWLPAEMESLGGQRARPLKLDTCGLTNCPNLRGIAPLSNRSGASPAPGQNPKPKNTNMQKITACLGLAADAAEDAVLAALGALKNRAEEATARLNHLTTTHQALLAEQAEADLARYATRIKPETQPEWRQLLLANRAAALALLAGIAEPAAPAPAPAPLHHRDAAGTPAPVPDDAGRAPAQLAAVAGIRNRQAGISFDAAWSIARRENPGLFQ